MKQSSTHLLMLDESGHNEEKTYELEIHVDVKQCLKQAEYQQK